MEPKTHRHNIDQQSRKYKSAQKIVSLIHSRLAIWTHLKLSVFCLGCCLCFSVVLWGRFVVAKSLMTFSYRTWRNCHIFEGDCAVANGDIAFLIFCMEDCCDQSKSQETVIGFSRSLRIHRDWLKLYKFYKCDVVNFVFSNEFLQKCKMTCFVLSAKYCIIQTLGQMVVSSGQSASAQSVIPTSLPLVDQPVAEGQRAPQQAW